MAQNNFNQLSQYGYPQDGNLYIKKEKYISEENLSEEMQKNLYQFYGNYATTEEVADTIRKVYEEDGYVLDPHTAVAVNVCDKYKEETGDTTPTLIASTASPYKFTRSVVTAIKPEMDSKEDFELVDELAALSGVKIPAAIEEIRNAEIKHDTVCEKDEMEAVVKKFLGIE